MAKIKIKKGDQVLVISGKDKGKKGEVLRVNKSANTLVVEGINISKKHIKNSPNVTQAGIVDTESPINISNVSLIVNKKSGRVNYKFDKNGNKFRVLAQTGDEV